MGTTSQVDVAADGTTPARRRRGRTRWVLAAVLLAAAVAVAAVAAARTGSSPPAAAPAASDTAGPVRVVVPGKPGEPATVTDSDRVPALDGAPYNGLDVEFARMMIPHHLQALRMAALAPDRAADARVRAVADRVRVAQVPEVRQLEAWLRQRGEPPEVAGHDHATMPGMQSAEAMRALAAARGSRFDRLFVTMMIAHHEGAVQMVGDVLRGGADPGIAELANEIAVEQTAEMNRMRQLGLG